MVREGRTPLLLAFGAHPGRCGPLVLEGDREFFRDSVRPFVERWVCREKRSAVMIHEYNVACEAGGGASVAHERKRAGEIGRSDDFERAQQKLDMLSLSINSMLSRTLGAGKDLERGMEWFDWGCAEDIIRMNRSRRGAVLNVIEPLVIEAAVLVNQAGSNDIPPGPDGRLQAEKEAVARAARICKVRSTALAGYIKELRNADPTVPIIVTRGFAHKGMESFFDQSEFEISSFSRLISAPWPSTEAALMGMNGEISDEALSRFARLSIHFGEYYESRMMDHLLDSIEDGVFNERKFAQLSHRAREYALGKLGL